MNHAVLIIFDLQATNIQRYFATSNVYIFVAADQTIVGFYCGGGNSGLSYLVLKNLLVWTRYPATYCHIPMVYQTYFTH